MCPIWCSSFLIDGPLLAFCVWSNISSLSHPQGNRIQTNKKSPQSLGVGLQMKKNISAEIVCICDQNQIFNKFVKLKLKPLIKNLTHWLIWKTMWAQLYTQQDQFEIVFLFQFYLFFSHFKFSTTRHWDFLNVRYDFPTWKVRMCTKPTFSLLCEYSIWIIIKSVVIFLNSKEYFYILNTAGQRLPLTFLVLLISNSQ